MEIPPAAGIALFDLTGASDAVRAEMLSLRNDPQVRRHMISGGEIAPDEHARWLVSLQGNPKTKVFAVMMGGDLAGQVNFTAIDRENGNAEWGFFVAPALRGRGIAAAMLSQALDMAFGEMGLGKVNAGVLSDNEASLALHRRFGFAPEGVRRLHKRREDRHADLVLFGITAREWRERRESVTQAADKGAGMQKDTAYYMDLIDQIEQIRGKNNKNWMDLLRLAFRHAPQEAGAIMAEIYKMDGDISQLAKKLTE